MKMKWFVWLSWVICGGVLLGEAAGGWQFYADPWRYMYFCFGMWAMLHAGQLYERWLT